MTQEQKSQKLFVVAKYWATDELENQKTHIGGEYLMERIQHDDLSDARCLLRMILKLIEEHNTRLNIKITLLKNLSYPRDWQSPVKWQSSKVFSGMMLPFKQIEKLISDNPDKDYYEIYRMLKGQ